MELRSNPRATGRGESKHSMSSLIGQGWAVPHLPMNPSAVTDWTWWAEPHLCLNPALCETPVVWYESCSVGLVDAVGRWTQGGRSQSWGLSNHRLQWRAPSSPRRHDSTTRKSTKTTSPQQGNSDFLPVINQYEVLNVNAEIFDSCPLWTYLGLGKLLDLNIGEESSVLQL